MRICFGINVRRTRFAALRVRRTFSLLGPHRFG